MITVIACPHPLRDTRYIFDLDGRPTVEDVVVEAAERGKVALSAMFNAVVVIGDRIIPKERWKHTRPKSGTVVVKNLPAGPVLPLLASAAGFAASWGVGGLIPTAFALAHPLITGAVQAGVTWVAPLQSRMTP